MPWTSRSHNKVGMVQHNTSDQTNNKQSINYPHVQEIQSSKNFN